MSHLPVKTAAGVLVVWALLVIGVVIDQQIRDRKARR
jgi:hypothetical protein